MFEITIKCENCGLVQTTKSNLLGKTTERETQRIPYFPIFLVYRECLMISCPHLNLSHESLSQGVDLIV